MDKTFNAVSHCGILSKKLIEAFGNDDRETTPGSVGELKEADTRQMLSEVLPVGMQVGTGFVIDTFGGTSKQQDIIIYEKDICPRFRISPNSKHAYHPCEAVIATGEIKSGLTAAQLHEAFENVASVKKLRRNTEQSDKHDGMGYPVRGYGNKVTIVGLEQFNPKKHSLDQIYSFVLAGRTEAQTKTLAGWLQAETRKWDEELCPNLFVVGDEIIVQPVAWDGYWQDLDGTLSPLGSRLGLSVESTQAYHLIEYKPGPCMENIPYTIHPHPIQQLLGWLWLVWEKGRTVPSEVMGHYITWNGTHNVGFEGYHIITKNGSHPPVTVL